MNKDRLAARIKRLQIVTTKLVEGLLAGNYRSVFRGPGIEFDEVREYVEGDDARLIDWNVSSRLSGTFTKTFREEREIVLFLVVDLSRSVFFPSGEKSRREIETLLVSLLSFAAIRNNDRVGAVFFTDRIEKWIPPRKGKKHALRLIKDIIDFKPEGRGSDLSQALRASGEALKRRGIVFVISDFKTSGYFPQLSVLGRKHDVIAVRIGDPADHEYPETGLAYLQDPETRETLVGAGFSRSFRGEYAEFQQFRNRQWVRECARQGIGVIDVFTGDDPGLKLVQFFRRRRRA
jgi:uncharacterized protein (DUF58 family)